MVLKSNESRRIFSLILAFILFAITMFPGFTALEGDQGYRDNPNVLRSDNWGFMTTFLYGEWPQFFGNWRYSLIITQLVTLLIGLSLLVPIHKLDSRLSIWLGALLYFVSANFSVQLWRDATSFSLSVLAFGLIRSGLSKKTKTSSGLIFLGLCIMGIASMFKPAVTLLLLPILAWLIWQENLRLPRSWFFKFFTMAIAGTLLIFAYVLDSSLARKASLERVFPEQQPILLDLAMNYCWGRSESIRVDSGNAISRTLKVDYPLESVCAATNPFRWDDLHNDPKDWQYSSPITRITNSKSSRDELLRSWTKIVTSHPVDWAQVRLLLIGPVLFMGNSFVLNPPDVDNPSLMHSLREGSWTFNSLFISIIDKIRLTSLFLCIFLCFSILLFSLKKQRPVFVSNLGDIYFALLVNILTLAVSVVSFVAPNGRYILGYVLLVYMMLLKSNLVYKSVLNNS